MVNRRYEEVESKTNALHHIRLKETQAIKKLVYACGDSLSNGFLFSSIHAGVLTLYFNHPSLAHEFTIGHEKYLSIMREVYKKEKMRDVVSFKKVIAKHRMPKKEVITNSKNPYTERSSGEFENNIQNPRVHSLFEDIREIIKERYNDSKTESV